MFRVRVREDLTSTKTGRLLKAEHCDPTVCKLCTRRTARYTIPQSRAIFHTDITCFAPFLPIEYSGLLWSSTSIGKRLGLWYELRVSTDNRFD